ncbi:protein of unknown function [Azospirillum baldaniorum]|uniref:Uncharacterized protein n=1 Tax=Azospirillum baldaniorum TaxID=1064539 RepID=A0A9P1JS94_9PROT|nr:protein of unknown function [Azospirillum baldaniorum]
MFKTNESLTAFVSYRDTDWRIIQILNFATRASCFLECKEIRSITETVQQEDAHPRNTVSAKNCKLIWSRLLPPSAFCPTERSLA